MSKKKDTVGTVSEDMEIEKEKAELANLMVRKVFEGATKLTIKVATCECPNKDECELYKAGKELAKIVDEFNEKLSS